MQSNSRETHDSAHAPLQQAGAQPAPGALSQQPSTVQSLMSSLSSRPSSIATSEALQVRDRMLLAHPSCDGRLMGMRARMLFCITIHEAHVSCRLVRVFKWASLTCVHGRAPSHLCYAVDDKTCTAAQVSGTPWF